MYKIDSLNDEIIPDFKKIKQKFELYETFYLGLNVNADSI